MMSGRMAAAVVCCMAFSGAAAQQPDEAAVIRSVDAAVHARIDALAGYTVTEHYSVYRNHDEKHPAAEMTVRTVYRKESGKQYTILSESGSEFIRSHVLKTLLENERTFNLPGTRESSWFTSANYEMKLKSGATVQTDGRACYALAISPRRKATNMIAGTLWVDAADGSIVRIEGNATQSPSIFTGPAQVMRRYAEMSGFAMATEARAVSESFLLGQTVVTIQYSDYAMTIQTRR